MAIVITAPTISDETRSATSAAGWTAISAGIALVATIPLLLMLQGPVSSLLFVRGTPNNGNWSYASTLLFVLLAPATYALFFATTGELLKTRVSKRVHKMTMRVAAVSMVPYLAMTTAGVFWQGGPQRPLLITAALTVPIAMVLTVWASSQNL